MPSRIWSTCDFWFGRFDGLSGVFYNFDWFWNLHDMFYIHKFTVNLWRAIKWFFTWLRCVNLLRHIWHEKGLSPVWMNWWRLSFEGVRNFFRHWLHSYRSLESFSASPSFRFEALPESFSWSLTSCAPKRPIRFSNNWTFSLEWRSCKCFFRLLRWVNPLLQIMQEKGLSPVWINWWRWSLDGVGNFFLQWEHSYRRFSFLLGLISCELYLWTSSSCLLSVTLNLNDLCTTRITFIAVFWVTHIGSRLNSTSQLFCIFHKSSTTDVDVREHGVSGGSQHSSKL